LNHGMPSLPLAWRQISTGAAVAVVWSSMHAPSRGELTVDVDEQNTGGRRLLQGARLHRREPIRGWTRTAGRIRYPTCVSREDKSDRLPFGFARPDRTLRLCQNNAVEA
jgi:hypothetical protein